jgi:hypothetical protein
MHNDPDAAWRPAASGSLDLEIIDNVYTLYYILTYGNYLGSAKTGTIEAGKRN